jgi:hypothetical protein
MLTGTTLSQQLQYTSHALFTRGFAPHLNTDSLKKRGLTLRAMILYALPSHQPTCGGNQGSIASCG